jgi:hypothetical protein
MKRGKGAVEIMYALESVLSQDPKRVVRPLTGREGNDNVLFLRKFVEAASQLVKGNVHCVVCNRTGRPDLSGVSDVQNECVGILGENIEVVPFNVAN